jgi:hypothetical protein
MSLTILLDAGPLGMITNPRSSPESGACKSWLASVASNGAAVMIPEIADYFVRRELLRAGKDRGIPIPILSAIVRGSDWRTWCLPRVRLCLPESHMSAFPTSL